MFGLGFTEILFIMVIALLVLGPKKLPQAARELGKITVQLRRAMDEFKHDIHQASTDASKQYKKLEHSEQPIQTKSDDSSTATENPNDNETSKAE